MRRGFVAAGPVLATCCECDRCYGRPGEPEEFSSIDEAADYFVDGADGWELYGDRLMCANCLPLSPCFNPGHDWHTCIGVIADNATLVTRQCTRCGLSVAEVLA
ncbi:hypothetical protein AB0M22_45405 [Nocardia sp. NPDC051756]|uniref:hypothetical protein n=1 Tax=Nocardia sp. NPDC051756 TaxID=3154751 RepID=UPI00342562A9